MTFQLCHCIPLRKSVKALAITDALLSVALITLIVLPFVRPARFLNSAELHFTKLFPPAVIILGISLAVLQILLAIRLYRGAKHVHHRENWKLWIRANSVLVVFYIISFLGLLLNTSFEKDFQRTYFGTTSIIFGLKLCVIPAVLLLNFGRERPLQKAVGHVHRPRHSEPHFSTGTLQPRHHNQTHIDFISPQNTTDFVITAHIT